VQDGSRYLCDWERLDGWAMRHYDAQGCTTVLMVLVERALGDKSDAVKCKMAQLKHTYRYYAQMSSEWMPRAADAAEQ